MKKVLSILLLPLYLIFSIGIVISAHYCGGSLAALAIDDYASCCCDDENTQQAERNCCDDETKTYKLQDNQLQTKIEKSFEKYSFIAIPLSTYSFHSQEIKSLPYTAALNKYLSVRPLSLPIYKLTHAYIFYG
ncbi:MAG: hypothetical protein R2831_13080 [Chitinophagaceae bacterium]